MMMFEVERFVEGVPASGEAPIVMPLAIIPGAVEYAEPAGDFHPEPGDGSNEAMVELMSLPSFEEQWAIVHDMLGGMVQMRTGATCPLGDLARNEGGNVACRAAYQLISMSPTLARLILSPESTFFGQLLAIGVHGTAYVQMVRASVNSAPVEFAHQTKQDEAIHDEQ